MWETLATEPKQERRTPDTVNTQDSYTTAQVISEPLEHLYEELTKQKKSKLKEVNTMSLGEAETDLEMNPPNLGGPSNLGNTSVQHG